MNSPHTESDAQIHRPKTRGELARHLKAGESCEIPDHGVEMTEIMIRGWLGVKDFAVTPSENEGYVIFSPTNSRRHSKMNDVEKERQISGHMKFHELQALWWMHAASNGHAGIRKMFHGINGPAFTGEELRDDAMQTAQRHMKILHNIADGIKDPYL